MSIELKVYETIEWDYILNWVKVLDPVINERVNMKDINHWIKNISKLKLKAINRI